MRTAEVLHLVEQQSQLELLKKKKKKDDSPRSGPRESVRPAHPQTVLQSQKEDDFNRPSLSQVTHASAMFFFFLPKSQNKVYLHS